MPIAKRVFVGRKNELDQFQQALGKPGLIERVVMGNPGRSAKSCVFLPFGIGGIGKSELTRQCVALAKQAGWKAAPLDWDRLGERPAKMLDVMNPLADALRSVDENAAKAFLADRTKAEGLEKKADRYMTEHPEEWQLILKGVDAVRDADPEPISKLTLTAARGVLDYGPKVLAKLIDTMMASQALKAEEVNLLSTPELVLARHLVEGIVEIAKTQSLVLVLDTCEVLPLAQEEFLRDQIVCPAVEQASHGLLVIISGRYSQYHAREVEDDKGRRRRVKGYADRLVDPPPVNWTLSQFAEPEIVEYLRQCDLDPKPDLIAYIQETARGIPFAVQLLVEALHTLGLERVQQEFRPNPSDVDLPGLVRQVVGRFLHYCLDNPTDQNRVQAMALLRERDDAALRVLWQLKPEENSLGVLDELQARYGFIQSDGRLHEVVRSFVREGLRGNDRETAHKLGGLAAQHYKAEWEAETPKFETVGERVSEKRWQLLTLNTLNALCWSDEVGAIRFLVGRALEGLEFDRSFAQGLIQQGREFRETENWWLSRTCRQFEALAKLVEGQESEVFTALESLKRDGADLKLDEVSQCILAAWQAHSLVGQTRVSEALQICQQAYKSAPPDQSVRWALARRLEEVGGILGFPQGVAIVSEEAKSAYELAVALIPTVAGYHVSLAGLLGQMGNYSEAMNQCTLAIAIDPTNEAIYNNRGILYKRLGKYEEALVDYDKAIGLNANNAIAYSNRGAAYQMLEKYQNASADYDKAIELNPEYATVYYNYGTLYKELKEYKKALASYGEAIRLSPRDMQPYVNRGGIYRLLNENEKALADYGEAIKLSPQDAAPYINRAVLYNDLKEYDQALVDYKKAIELDSQDASSYFSRATTYTVLKEYAKAVADYGMVIALNAQDGEAYNQRGIVLNYLGNFSAALKDFEAAISLTPQDPAPVYNSACSYALQSRATEACQWLRKTINMDKTYIELCKTDLDFDQIRDTPDFQALFKEYQ